MVKPFDVRSQHVLSSSGRQLLPSHLPLCWKVEVSITQWVDNTSNGRSAQDPKGPSAVDTTDKGQVIVQLFAVKVQLDHSRVMPKYNNKQKLTISFHKSQTRQSLYLLKHVPHHSSGLLR